MSPELIAAWRYWRQPAKAAALACLDPIHRGRRNLAVRTMRQARADVRYGIGRAMQPESDQ